MTTPKTKTGKETKHLPDKLKLKKKIEQYADHSDMLY